LAQPARRNLVRTTPLAGNGEGSRPVDSSRHDGARFDDLDENRAIAEEAMMFERDPRRVSRRRHGLRLRAYKPSADGSSSRFRDGRVLAQTLGAAARETRSELG
jgi:hypothetical protein